MKTEFEARFVLDDAEAFAQKLPSLGFEQVYPETLMRRYVYNIPGKGKSWYARVRDEGQCVSATVKCVTANTINGVQEAEIKVDNFDAAHTLFTLLGLQQKAYQETKRALWRGHTVELMIDTWPGLPTYVEIEGQSEADVRKIAAFLGFAWGNASFGAVDDLYTKYLGWDADEINMYPEITFAQPPQAKIKG